MGARSAYGGMALSVLRSIVMLASFILIRCHNQPLITYLFIIHSAQQQHSPLERAWN